MAAEAEAELELDSFIADIVLRYLKDNNYTATGQAFSEECPYLSSDDEARPSESLEEIVRNYRRQKQFNCEWEECGQGQVLNNLCTKLQSCVEDIKSFAVRAHKSTEKTTAIKSRSRVFGRSHRVNLMHPLQPVATMLSPTAAMPTNAIPSVSMPTVTMPTVTMPTVTMSSVSIPKPTGVTQSATKLTVSKSPLKRKGLSPQKCPVPKQPALGVHGSSLHSTSPPASSGGASSERGQQPSSAEHLLLEKMLNSHGLHQKLADSINQCATRSSSEEDELVESVLNMTEADPSFNQLLDSLLEGSSNMAPLPAAPMQPSPKVGDASTSLSHATRDLQPLPPEFRSDVLSIDKFLDQLHASK